ncbi:hypothetical protein [Streptomyces althioticus]|uniref:hypothetical protein n=1 Tax=Streptomyces althioticus TaxID=83380 RepID=UPI003EBA5C1D
MNDMNALQGGVTAWAAGRSGAPARDLAGRLSVRKGRKIRCGRILAEALGGARAPASLDGLLAALRPPARTRL